MSPFIERAKLAFSTFQERVAAFDEAATQQHWDGAKRQAAWTHLLNAGHPSPNEIKTIRRDLGTITHAEVRGIIIRAMLRDTPEDRRAYEVLTPWQQLTRTVTNWIMEAFDEA